jgi:hypothetical protein
MLVSATIGGTLPAAAELPNGTPHVGGSHADLARTASAIALEAAPALFRCVASKRLAENFGLGAAFLPGQAFGLADYVRGKGQRSDSRRRHRAFLD